MEVIKLEKHVKSCSAEKATEADCMLEGEGLPTDVGELVVSWNRKRNRKESNMGQELGGWKERHPVKTTCTRCYLFSCISTHPLIDFGLQVQRDPLVNGKLAGGIRRN